VLEQEFLMEGAKEGAKQVINEATVPNLKEDPSEKVRRRNVNWIDR